VAFVNVWLHFWKHTMKNKENDIMEVMNIGEREMLLKEVLFSFFNQKRF
jgi:hypothetical protein